LLTTIQAALALVAAVLVCYFSLPDGSERRWALLAAVVAGMSLGALVRFGDPGTVTKYLSEYYLLTTACMIASGMGIFTALYVACFHQWRDSGAALGLGWYFAVDVAANALYRRTEYVYDFQRMLQAGVHMGHLAGLVAVAIWGIRRER
jgi:hypothetical protein